MAKSVIEQLSELDADLGAKIKEVIKAHPKLAADDRQMSELFGFYLGLMVWGGLWLRDKSLRASIPFRR